MNGTTEAQAGCFNLGVISLCASLLGSILGAIVLVLQQDMPTQLPSIGEAILFTVVGGGLVVFFGGVIAIPVGLAVGMPLLALFGKIVARWPIAAVVAFGLIGLIGGRTIQWLWEGGGLQNAELIFGACVGGMHAAVYARVKGVGWLKLLAAALVAGAIVPAGAYAYEDYDNMMASREQYEHLCADRYNSMAFIGDRQELEQGGAGKRHYKGEWLNARRWRSLYERTDSIPLDDTRMLLAHDYAYVPGGFAGWITGGRRVERHCASEKKGGAGDVLRLHNVGVRPRLSDLAD